MIPQVRTRIVLNQQPGGGYVTYHDSDIEDANMLGQPLDLNNNVYADPGEMFLHPNYETQEFVSEGTYIPTSQQELYIGAGDVIVLEKMYDDGYGVAWNKSSELRGVIPLTLFNM